MGAIRDVVVNDRKFSLGDQATSGEVQVVRCDSRQYRVFMEVLGDIVHPEMVNPWLKYESNSESSSYSDDSMSSFFDHDQEQASAPKYWQAPIPGLGRR